MHCPEPDKIHPSDFRRGIVPHDDCPDGIPPVARTFARRIRAVHDRAPFSYPGHICPGRNLCVIASSGRIHACPSQRDFESRLGSLRDHGQPSLCGERLSEEIDDLPQTGVAIRGRDGAGMPEREPHDSRRAARDSQPGVL